jgi:hypothetical protein
VTHFGYTRGLLYKRHKHLIRKDGRKSFVLGRDLLADIAASPTLAPSVPMQAGAVPMPRRRGRPRKVQTDGPAAGNAA